MDRVLQQPRQDVCACVSDLRFACSTKKTKVKGSLPLAETPRLYDKFKKIHPWLVLVLQRKDFIMLQSPRHTKETQTFKNAKDFATSPLGIQQSTQNIKISACPGSQAWPEAGHLTVVSIPMVHIRQLLTMYSILYVIGC